MATVCAEKDSPRRTLVQANNQFAQILAPMLSDPVGAAAVDWHNLTLMAALMSRKLLKTLVHYHTQAREAFGEGMQQLGETAIPVFGAAHTLEPSYFPEAGRDDQADVGRVRLTIDTSPVELT